MAAVGYMPQADSGGNCCDCPDRDGPCDPCAEIPCADYPWYTSLSGTITLGGTAQVAGCYTACDDIEWQDYPVSGGTSLFTTGNDNFAEETGWYLDGADCSTANSIADMSVICITDVGGHSRFYLVISVQLLDLKLSHIAPADPPCLLGLDCCGVPTLGTDCSQFNLQTYQEDAIAEIPASACTPPSFYIFLGGSPIGTFGGTVPLAYSDPTGGCQQGNDCAVASTDWPCCSDGLDSSGRGSMTYSVTIS